MVLAVALSLGCTKSSSAPPALVTRVHLLEVGERGDAARARGDLPSALASYREALAIAEKLAAADDSYGEAQRDLCVTLERVGAVLFTQRELPEALAVSRRALAISEKLAARHPSIVQLQEDLGGSLENVGEVLRAQGDLPNALASFRKALAIAETLAAADPTNAVWRDDVKRLGVAIQDTGSPREP
jgi:tetratricopeptide (TPR) repeat protein